MPLTCLSIDHTLSIWLGIQFRQCYTHKKERKLIKIVNIFGLAGPCDPSVPDNNSKFVESPLLID